METERLEFLLNHYFDLSLSAGEKQELEKELLGSPTAREAFWELSRWHGAIRQWGEEEWGHRDAKEAVAKVKQAPLRVLPSPKRISTHAQRQRKPVQRPFAQNSIRLLAVAAAVALGFFAWTKWTGNPVRGQAIAQLIHASEAVWEKNATAPQEGDALSRGTLKLKSGVLQINFSRGAHVVLEGPVEFELLTDNSGALHHGKLIATVPDSAHGFSVKAPDFSVVDHGTQFGCIVPMAASPEVHVIQGAVGVKPSGKAERQLHGNQAVRLTGLQMEEIPANADAFFTEEKLMARLNLENWRKFNSSFSQREGMLVHFDFEKENGDDLTLINRAPHASPTTNGNIEGCNWVAGRWEGKGALKFCGNNDRVRLSLPEQYSALTFVAFFQADEISNRENSLIQTKPQNGLGETSWYISNEGALTLRTRVAPRGNAGQWLRIPSEPVVRGESFRSWHMVATVYDGKTVTHYLDGKKIGSIPVVLPGPVVLGDLQIGNGELMTAAPRTPNEASVSLSGTIDQLSILSVPLSDEEVGSIYRQSRIPQTDSL